MAQGPAEERQSSIYDYGAEDSQEPGLLTIEPESYFGRPLGDLTRESLRKWGLDPDSGPLTRHSYLYSVDYPINTGGPGGDGSEWGKIELRGKVWTHSAQVPERLATVVEQTAHRAATCFNTTTVTADYAGYLDGFHPQNPGGGWEDATTNWEEEVVGGSSAVDAQAGRLDWNVEIYDEAGRISGVAQGVASPWYVSTKTTEYEPPREEFRLREQDARGEYEIRAQTTDTGQQTNQGKRAKRVLPGKNVYVNDKPVGTWRKARGSAAIKLDYTRPPTINGRKTFDRQRLVDETEATPQALRDGGKLYKVEETSKAIYLVTARRRPDKWDPVDPEDMDPNAGTEARTEHSLGLRTASQASAISCRRDETQIRLLGLSVPPWSADVSRGWTA